MRADRTLDLCGLNCPLHVLRCKAGLIKTPPGELLRVRMTELGCRHDISLLVASLGDKLEYVSDDGYVTEFWIRRHVTRTTVCRAAMQDRISACGLWPWFPGHAITGSTIA
jgi:tRNA 2-thiouridine synthesizing protein A